MNMVYLFLLFKSPLSYYNGVLFIYHIVFLGLFLCFKHFDAILNCIFFKRGCNYLLLVYKNTVNFVYSFQMFKVLVLFKILLTIFSDSRLYSDSIFSFLKICIVISYYSFQSIHNFLFYIFSIS